MTVFSSLISKVSWSETVSQTGNTILLMLMLTWPSGIHYTKKICTFNSKIFNVISMVHTFPTQHKSAWISLANLMP